jgi:hypothetical protein
VVEIFLLQTIFYIAIWLTNEYVASYLCLILPCVAAVILLISWLADLIEPGHVGLKYYSVMAITVVTPLIVGGFFYLVYDGNIGWLRDEFSR